MREGKFNKRRKIDGSANKKSYLPYIEMDCIRSALRRDCIASYNTIFFYFLSSIYAAKISYLSKCSIKNLNPLKRYRIL